MMISKYDFNTCFDNNTTYGKIFERITPRSRVLENSKY